MTCLRLELGGGSSQEQTVVSWSLSWGKRNVFIFLCAIMQVLGFRLLGLL